MLNYFVRYLGFDVISYSKFLFHSGLRILNLQHNKLEYTLIKDKLPFVEQITELR